MTVAAGLATLGELEAPGVYEGLEEKGRKLQEGLEAALGEGLPGTVNRVGSMLTLFLGPRPGYLPGPCAGAATATASPRFFHGMLARGVYLPPSPFEALVRVPRPRGRRYRRHRGGVCRLGGGGDGATLTGPGPRVSKSSPVSNGTEGGDGASPKSPLLFRAAKYTAAVGF